MICNNCKNEIDDFSANCPYCGMPAEQNAPATQIKKQPQNKEKSLWVKIVAVLGVLLVLLGILSIVLTVKYNKLGESPNGSNMVEQKKPEVNKESEKDTVYDEAKPSQNTTTERHPANQIIESVQNAQVGDIVYFGYYPQKEVTTPAQKIALKQKIDNQWEVSSYQDIKDENGQKYRAVKNGDDIDFYEFTEIEWIVLDPSTGLIISKNNLAALPFDESGSNTYDGSSIKRWLINEFYYNALKIYDIQHTIDTNERNDKVFLLSETVFNQYMYNENFNNFAITDYTDFALIENNPPEGLWWLQDAKITYSGSGVQPGDIYGVRPALYINVNSN